MVVVFNDKMQLVIFVYRVTHRHPEDGVEDGGDLADLGGRRDVAVPWGSRKEEAIMFVVS